MKRYFTKGLSLILCVATLLSFAVIFISCNSPKDENDTKEMTVIVEDGQSSYAIIRQDKIGKVILNSVQKLYKTVYEDCGCNIRLTTDWVKSEEDIDPDAKELLIGNTNRPETKEVLESLEPNSWAVVNKGNKIVICASNDALLSAAVDWFIENCVNTDDKTVKIAKNLVKTDGFGNNIPISIGGASSYQIVYPKGNGTLEYYAGLIQRRTKINGEKIEVVPDIKAQSENEIVIGKTNRGENVSFDSAYGYSITTKDNSIYINAANEKVLYYAVNYFIEHGLTISESVVSCPSDYNQSAILENYYSEKWGLNLPYIEEGNIAPMYNTGTGLVSDEKADTIYNSYMHLVSNVKYTYLENYAKKLESFGFKKIYSSKTDENDLWCYRLGGAYAYIHYSPNLKCIRVIWDKSSTCEVSDIEYVEEQTGTTTFYQYSLDYTDAKLNFSGYGANCGMLYLVKLQDNSLIMIDSGGAGQGSDKSLKGLCDFLYKITNTKQNEALKIRFWYFTHPDGDHNGLFNKLMDYMQRNNLKIPDLEALGFNYPSKRANGTVNVTGASYQMIANVNKLYPDINYLKLHTGMVFNIGELKFEVLGTVESLVEASGKIKDTYDTNDTCALVRFSFGGKSVLIAGDIGNDIGSVAWYTALYSSEYLKSDILQASHHGYNLTTKLNASCAPEYVLISNSAEYLSTRKTHYEYYLNLVETSKLHFAGNYTTALEVANGKITFVKIHRYDYPG